VRKWIDLFEQEAGRQGADPSVLADVTQLVAHECAEANCEVEGVWLYGSRQTGSACEDSDYDILVVISGGEADEAQDALNNAAPDWIENAMISFVVVTTDNLHTDKTTVAFKAYSTGERLL
jgi:predicted nucleotidyltransferase